MNVDFPTPVSPNSKTLISFIDDGDLCTAGEGVDDGCC